MKSTGLAIGLLLSAAAQTSIAADQHWTVPSPDGKLVATVGLVVPQGDSGPARLAYRLEHGPEGRRVEVLGWSPLGIVRDDAAFVDGMKLVDRPAPVDVNETYRLAHGKRSQCHSVARQQSFVFATASGRRVELVVRVSNDALAFRYRFPEKCDSLCTVKQELTGFQVRAGAKAWMTPYSEASMWTPAYEEYYTNAIPAGTTSEKKAGWAFPALFHVGGSRWVLLTEAGEGGSYCGCRLAAEAPGALYRIRFPDAAEGHGLGPVEPRSRLPWSTPWRVVMVAETLAGIVESTVVTDLNPPSRVADASWIRPGRVAWSWWSDHDSPRDYRKQCEFVDLAAEMGWEYVLVDANWDLMDHGNVRELVDYARRKGVDVWLWYNSGGAHNVVTEKPRGCMEATELRTFEFGLLAKWGVRGVKVDFFQSDKQNVMALYQGILRDAAKHKIMVNFHGCTVPRGWERTWPHLMSMEAVRGEECYTFAAEYPARAPQYNTILPFTRNAVGPMDYTPCAFTDDKYPHLTSNAHELALAVLFESGLLHGADRTSAYRQLPDEPKDFLRRVPVAWDETRYLAGQPGEFVALARRKGDTWYVAVINGQDHARRVSVPLDRLGGARLSGVLIADGSTPRTFASRPITVEPGKPLEIQLLPHGGAAARLGK